MGEGKGGCGAGLDIGRDSDVYLIEANETRKEIPVKLRLALVAGTHYDIVRLIRGIHIPGRICSDRLNRSHLRLNRQPAVAAKHAPVAGDRVNGAVGSDTLRAKISDK